MELTRDQIIEFLRHPKKFAIIGASTNPNKAGNYVPEFLKNRGFEIIPINPMTNEILGIETLDDLEDMDEQVDGVIIYRHTEAAEEEALKAIDKGIPLVWFPRGITSEKIKKVAEKNNIKFVQDKCPKAQTENFIKEGIYDN